MYSAQSVDMRTPGTAGKLADYLYEINTVLIFLLLVFISSMVSDVFFTQRNLFNLLRQISGTGIMSFGMLLVILTGGIDLSVGSVMALCSVLLAVFINIMPLPAAIPAVILTGVAAGLISGYLVANRRVAAFIATLAMMTIARGLALIISRGTPVMTGEAGAALRSFGRGYFFGIPQPVLLMFAVFAVIWFVLRYTSYGRLIIAVGSNETAVRLSGIPTSIYKCAVYAVSGAFAAIAGIVSISRTGVGSPVVGTGIELDVIAAVVIGGASLSGGRGTAVNTLLGCIILGMIGNIMNLMNIPGYHQQVIKGLIIVFAVLLQTGWKKRDN